MNNKLISGVKIKNLKIIPDERGRLMEILRNDDDLFSQFGQIYMTTTYSGVVKAWHYHNLQDDNIVCISGMIKLALYDARENSPTYGVINEFFIGEYSQKLIKIPAHIYHGWKCISTKEAIIINIPTNTYNYEQPDEIRLDPHINDIPYDWARKDG